LPLQKDYNALLFYCLSLPYTPHPRNGVKCPWASQNPFILGFSIESGNHNAEQQSCRMKNVVIAISVAILIAVCVAGLTMAVVVQQLKIREQHEQIFALKKVNLELASRVSQPEPLPARELLNAVKASDVNLVDSILKVHPGMLQAGIGADGATPLHAAVYNGKVAVVEQLLRLNADVNARNELGSTPIHDAIASGRLEILTLLLDKKPDLRLRNKAGQTALGVAMAKDRPDLAELLLVHGAKE